VGNTTVKYIIELIINAVFDWTQFYPHTQTREL